MKISIRLVTISLVIVFIIALVILYLNYQKQVTAQDLANQNLTTAQTALTRSNTEKTNATKQLEQANNQLTQLQNKLSQAKQNLAKAETTLPNSLNSIDYTDIIYETAHNSNVSIQYPLQTLNQESPADSTNGNITFRTYPFSFSVKADNLTNIINFLHALATEEQFKDATIETVGIGTSEDTVTTTNPDGTQTKTTVTKRTMDVTITLYTYKS